MTIHRPSPAATIALPIQAAPVSRDTTQPSPTRGDQGLAAAASSCSGLRGLARQLCYATRYGVST